MSISTKDQATALIRRANKILCVTQADARADSVAAMLTLQSLGQKMGKEVVTVLPQGVNKNLKFLTGHDQVTDSLGEPGDFVISLSTKTSDVERVKYTLEEDSVDIIITPKKGSFRPEDVTFRHNAAHFDLIIIFDCANFEALGSVFSDHTEIFANAPTLSLSANPGTTDFANTNLVDPTKAAVSEILFDLLYHNNELQPLIDPSIATNLLTGLIASTGSFLRPNTTASSLEAAAILQGLGAEQSNIIEQLFKQKTFNTLKLWGRIFATLEVDPTHKLAWAYLGSSDVKQLDANNEDIDQITAEILRYTEAVDLAVLAYESGEDAIIQLRSKNQNFSWKEMAGVLPVKLVEHGADIVLPNHNAATAIETIMQHLLPWQKQRLQLPLDMPLQKLQPQQPATPQPTLPIETINKSGPVTATPPANVPFVAPTKAPMIPEEHTPVPGTKAAEVIIDTNQKGIPDWLKKSFPSN